MRPIMEGSPLLVHIVVNLVRPGLPTFCLDWQLHESIRGCLLLTRHVGSEHGPTICWSAPPNGDWRKSRLMCGKQMWSLHDQSGLARLILCTFSGPYFYSVTALDYQCALFAVGCSWQNLNAGLWLFDVLIKASSLNHVIIKDTTEWKLIF